MSYKVKIKNKVKKNLRKMPVAIQQNFDQLVDDLIANGPIQPFVAQFFQVEKK